MLTRFGFSEMHPQNTPMIPNKVMNRERKMREQESDIETLIETESRENVPYREAVGSLLYLANSTRPDILYAVNVLVISHQLNPCEEDWKMVKRIFRYKEI